MSLQNALLKAQARHDLALQAADMAFGPQNVFRQTARMEAGSLYQQDIAAAFDADFEGVIAGWGMCEEKLPKLSAAFVAQKQTYESVFNDTVNREICRKESMKALQKAFRAVLAKVEEGAAVEC